MQPSFKNFITVIAGLWAASIWAAEPAKLPKLIDLGADKCIPCKMMAPILADLKTNYAGRLEDRKSVV